MIRANYRERTVQFGRDYHLNGIFTLPKGLKQAPSACLLMFNSGIINRTGSCRIQVELARRLCSLGIASLRFDLSGLGDSTVPESKDGIQAIIDKDVEEAIQFSRKELQQTPVIGFGLCSGAHDLMRSVETQGGLAGAIIIDLPGHYGHAKHLRRHYGSRIYNLESWKKITSSPLKALSSFKQRLRYNLPPDNFKVEQEGEEIGIRPHMSQQRIASILNTAIEEEIALYFIFTGGMSEYYNYSDHFADVFPIQSQSDTIDWKFLAESDHTFTRHKFRSWLYASVEDWLTDCGFSLTSVVGLDEPS